MKKEPRWSMKREQLSDRVEFARCHVDQGQVFEEFTWPSGKPCLKKKILNWHKIMERSGS